MWDFRQQVAERERELHDAEQRLMVANRKAAESSLGEPVPRQPSSQPASRARHMSMVVPTDNGGANVNLLPTSTDVRDQVIAELEQKARLSQINLEASQQREQMLLQKV